MVAVVLLAVLAITPASAHDQLSSCAWVRAENDGAGAGFIIDVEKRLLITCRHLVADRTMVDVIFPWIRGGELVTERREYLGNRSKLRELGLLVRGKVMKTSDELDLALLELESLPPTVKAVNLTSQPPPTGEAIRVVGNRLDLETVWNVTTGPVRASGRLADGYFWRGKKLATNAGAIIGQLPTEEGDSGGPVFDSRGELVGIVSALRRQCPLAAVIISAADIRKFAGLPEAKHTPRTTETAETLTRATVWVQPTATDGHLAGVLIDNDLVLTTGKGMTPGDRVGLAFPIREGQKWVAERTAYRDPLELHFRGSWRSGTVVARDADRALTLIRLDSPVEFMRPVKLATRSAVPGDAIHTMNHPGGLEFAWVYAGGAVRQRGKVSLGNGDDARPVAVVVCQLPAQAGSPGGPVLNDRGELLGLVAAKESAQMVGYVVAAGEIAEFLDVSRLDQSARTVAGLRARLEAVPRRWRIAAAMGLGRRAEDRRAAGMQEAAYDDSRAAVALDPGCLAARVVRVHLLLTNDRPEVALQELDVAVEKGPFDRSVLLWRAELAALAKDWRKARGDLERILDVNPADPEARQRLIGVLVELGEDAKAATAVSDTLRADPKRLPAVATDLLAQAEKLATRFPDAPAIAAGWLLKAMTAANREEFTTALTAARAAKDEAEQLAVLRAGLKKIAGK